MPSYPFLFTTKARLERGDVQVQLPPGEAPPGQLVTANAEALDLVAYLKALEHTYPVADLPARR